MSKTIEITVSPQGDTTVTTKGFAGGECREASRFLEQALGTQQRIARLERQLAGLEQDR